MKVTAKEAAGHLTELIERAASGGEVVIAGAKKSVRLVPCSDDESQPVFGSAKGLLRISDDFDEPLRDFDKYMR